MIQAQVGNDNITIPSPAQIAADSLYPPRNRRHDSKSEPGGFNVSFDASLDLEHAESQGSQETMVVTREVGGGGGNCGASEESTNTMIRFSQVSEGSRIEIARVGERKGILKNVGQEKRRVSAPARESLMFADKLERQKRRERIPTPMAIVGELIGPGLGRLGVSVPVMQEGGMERDGDGEMERGVAGPPVSFVTQGAQSENQGRRMYMGGGLMRGKRRGWRIRSRAVDNVGTGAQGNGGMNESVGIDGMGGLEGGGGGGSDVEVGAGSVGKNGNGKGKGKGRGSVRFADDV